MFELKHKSKNIAKSIANATLNVVGARAVGVNWGPKGFLASFSRARSAGFVPRTIIDIGASDGRWSEACMGVFPNARYVLFDALPANELELSIFATKHNNVIFRSIALGECAGRVELHVHGHQSSLYTSKDFIGSSIEVEVRSLDSFLDELDLEGPILLKADVQGHELSILRGAKKVMAMTEMALLEVSFREVYECAPLAHETIADMARYGFRIYDICTYSQRQRDHALVQADIAFARAESALFRDEQWT